MFDPWISYLLLVVAALLTKIHRAAGKKLDCPASFLLRRAGRLTPQ